MEQDILLDGKPVGTAFITRQGLYWCFACCCQLPGLCTLIAESDTGQQNLGIPVPEGGQFVLRKQIPIRKLGTGPMTIRVVPKRQGSFFPVNPKESFTELLLLPRAVYQVRQGQVGVFMPEPE